MCSKTLVTKVRSGSGEGQEILLDRKAKGADSS